MEDILRRIEQLEEKIRVLEKLPMVDYGTVRLTVKGWHRIAFKRPFAEKPTVLVFGEARSGEWSPISVKIPSVEKPRVEAVSVPPTPKVTLDIDVPDIKIPEIKFDFHIPEVPTIKELELTFGDVTLNVEEIKKRIKEILSPVVPSITIPTLEIPKYAMITAGCWDVDFYHVRYSWGGFGDKIGDRINDIFPPIFHMDWGDGCVFQQYSDHIGFKAYNWIYIPEELPRFLGVEKVPVTFTIGGDDGVRLWIKRPWQTSWTKVLDDWRLHSYRISPDSPKTLNLDYGKWELRFDFYEWEGDAAASFLMLPPPIVTSDAEQLNVHFWADQTSGGALVYVVDQIVEELKKYGLGWIFEPLVKNTKISGLIFWIGKMLGRGAGIMVSSFARSVFRWITGLVDKVNSDIDKVKERVSNVIDELVTGSKGVKAQVDRAFKELVGNVDKKTGMTGKTWDAFETLCDDVKKKVENSLTTLLFDEEHGVKKQVEDAFNVDFKEKVRNVIKETITILVKGDEVRGIAGLEKTLTDKISEFKENVRAGVYDAFTFFVSNDYGTGVKQQVENAFSKNNSAMTGNINEALDKLAENIKEAVYRSLEDLRSKTEISVNEVLPELWRSHGLPEGALISTVLYRNVDETGFEVWCPGDITVHFIAIGSSKIEIPRPII